MLEQYLLAGSLVLNCIVLFALYRMRKEIDGVERTLDMIVLQFRNYMFDDTVYEDEHDYEY
jgi:hypothetical protein